MLPRPEPRERQAAQLAEQMEMEVQEHETQPVEQEPTARERTVRMSTEVQEATAEQTAAHMAAAMPAAATAATMPTAHITAVTEQEPATGTARTVGLRTTDRRIITMDIKNCLQFVQNSWYDEICPEDIRQNEF